MTVQVEKLQWESFSAEPRMTSWVGVLWGQWGRGLVEAEGRRTEGNVTSQSRTAEEESRLAQRDVSDLQLAHRCPIPTSHRPCHVIHTLVMGPAHLTDDTEKPYMFFCFFSKPQKERWSCVEDFMSSWIHQRWIRTPFLLLLAAWITRREFVFKKFYSGLPGCDGSKATVARRLSQGKQQS